MSFKFSFIVASVDRDEQLRQCISSIEKAHEFSPDIPVEILVVIQKAKREKDIPIRYPGITAFYYIDKLGLSVARNFAIEKSKGDYFIFLDDDAAVKEDFIAVLTKETLRYDKTGAFCGKLIDYGRQVPFSRLFYNNSVKKLGRLDYQYFMGSAHVLSREVVERIGSYDERFGVGSRYYGSEETDIFFRLKAAGRRVLYLPDLIFFHPATPASADYRYKYAYALAAMAAKNCVNDKFFSPIYCFIILERVVKSSIRILQAIIFKGAYLKKDQQYHYASVLKGTFTGIKDFISREL